MKIDYTYLDALLKELSEDSTFLEYVDDGSSDFIRAYKSAIVLEQDGYAIRMGLIEEDRSFNLLITDKGRVFIFNGGYEQKEIDSLKEAKQPQIHVGHNISGSTVNQSDLRLTDPIIAPNKNTKNITQNLPSDNISQILKWVLNNIWTIIIGLIIGFLTYFFGWNN